MKIRIKRTSGYEPPCEEAFSEDVLIAYTDNGGMYETRWFIELAENNFFEELTNLVDEYDEIIVSYYYKGKDWKREPLLIIKDYYRE